MGCGSSKPSDGGEGDPPPNRPRMIGESRPLGSNSEAPSAGQTPQEAARAAALARAEGNAKKTASASKALKDASERERLQREADRNAENLRWD